MEKKLNELFMLRHEFTHDANSKTNIDDEDILSYQRMILNLTQLTTLYLCEIFQDTMFITMQNEEEIPYFFMPGDLIATDWHIVEKSEKLGIGIKNLKIRTSQFVRQS